MIRGMCIDRDIVCIRDKSTWCIRLLPLSIILLLVYLLTFGTPGVGVGRPVDARDHGGKGMDPSHPTETPIVFGVQPWGTEWSRGKHSSHGDKDSHPFLLVVHVVSTVFSQLMDDCSLPLRREGSSSVAQNIYSRVFVSDGYLQWLKSSFRFSEEALSILCHETCSKQKW